MLRHTLQLLVTNPLYAQSITWNLQLLLWWEHQSGQEWFFQNSSHLLCYWPNPSPVSSQVTWSVPSMLATILLWWMCKASILAISHRHCMNFVLLQYGDRLVSFWHLWHAHSQKQMWETSTLRVQSELNALMWPVQHRKLRNVEGLQKRMNWPHFDLL